MASAAQLDSLDPALKRWLDDVIVPALVREYLAECQDKNQLVESRADVAQFAEVDRVAGSSAEVEL